MSNNNAKEILKQRLIKRLGEIISAELDKPDNEVDMELIHECDAWLEELMQDNVRDEKLESAVRILNEPVKRSGKRLRKGVAIILAAAITVMSLIVVCFAVPGVRNWFATITRMGNNASIQDNEITYIHLGNRSVYKSIDDVRQNTGLDCIIPIDPTDDIQLNRIVDNSDQQVMVLLLYSDNSSIKITNSDSNYKETIIYFDNTKSYIDSSLGRFYLLNEKSPTGEIIYGSLLITPKYTYSLTCSNKEQLEKIIQLFD